MFLTTGVRKLFLKSFYRIRPIYQLADIIAQYWPSTGISILVFMLSGISRKDFFAFTGNYAL